MKLHGNIFLLLILIITACNMKIEEREENYEVYVNEIIYDFSKEVAQKYQLRCIGSGGSMPYDVVSIYVPFYKSTAFQSIEEARKTMIDLVDLLTKKVNEHKKIKPFLHITPFPESNSHISISIENQERNNNSHTEEIVLIVNCGGIFSYASYDGIVPVTKFEETYDEAVKKNQEYLEKKKAVTSSSTE